MYVCMGVCEYGYMCVWVYVCLGICVAGYMCVWACGILAYGANACIHACPHAHVLTHAKTHTHTCANMHTHIHILYIKSSLLRIEAQDGSSKGKQGKIRFLLHSITNAVHFVKLHLPHSTICFNTGSAIKGFNHNCSSEQQKLCG